MSTTITDDLIIKGRLVMSGASSVLHKAGSVGNPEVSETAGIARTKLALNTVAYRIPWSAWRIFDAVNSSLPVTSSGNDMAINAGTHGTDVARMQTYDVKAANVLPFYARAFIPMPIEYANGETALIRASAGMITTIAGVACTLDFEGFAPSRTGTLGTDLVTTAATSINSVTFANYDYAMDEATLVAGDLLDILLKISVNDAATATAVIAALYAIELVCDVQG